MRSTGERLIDQAWEHINANPGDPVMKCCGKRASGCVCLRCPKCFGDFFACPCVEAVIR